MGALTKRPGWFASLLDRTIRRYQRKRSLASILFAFAIGIYFVILGTVERSGSVTVWAYLTAASLIAPAVWDYVVEGRRQKKRTQEGESGLESTTAELKGPTDRRLQSMPAKDRFPDLDKGPSESDLAASIGGLSEAGTERLDKPHSG